MSVEEVDWGEWRKQRDNPSRSPMVTAKEDGYARQDMKDIRAYVKRAPKRKGVPPGTAPLELWHMCLFPKVRIRQRFGLGAERSPPSTSMFFALLQVGLLEARLNQQTPLYWHKSAGASLKKSEKVGAEGRRVVHVLPAIGKAYYASKLK
eukprot:1240745-Lingulodinium_polyedra.AAC.1